jgi:Uma2 family endonuclease
MNEMTRVLAPSVANYRARFTTAEFQHMCKLGAFGDMKVELVDGEIERLNLPKNDHARLQSLLMFELLRVLGRDALDRVRGEVGIDLGDDTVLGGDATLFRHAVADPDWLRPEHILLVMEVSVTTLGRDLEMKLPRYAAAGIPHYWVIDAKRALVHAHSNPVEGDYKKVLTVRFGEPLAVPGTDANITLS